MDPKSISATLLAAWEACPAMCAAENIARPPKTNNVFADLGSAVHTALEYFVKGCFIDNISGAFSTDVLRGLWETSYDSYFGSNREFYDEGWGMLTTWLRRNPLDFWQTRKVISTELKSSFAVPTSIGPIPCNYIFDRVDEIPFKEELPDGEGYAEGRDIEVVDYKSWRLPRKPEDLKKSPQMRLYGLAAQIQFKDARRIWVTLDQLRYDEAGTVFTRQDNINTWEWIKKKAQEIVDCTVPEEKINSNCKWCIRKHECLTLAASVESGNILPTLSVDEVTKRLHDVTSRKAALEAVEGELQKFIHEHAKTEDLDSYSTDEYDVELKVSSRRGVDPQRVAAIIGQDIFSRYGKMNMAEIDVLLKGDELTADQKRALKQVIQPKFGTDPKIVIKPKNPLDET